MQPELKGRTNSNVWLVILINCIEISEWIVSLMITYDPMWSSVHDHVWSHVIICAWSCVIMCDHIMRFMQDLVSRSFHDQGFKFCSDPASKPCMIMGIDHAWSHMRSWLWSCVIMGGSLEWSYMITLGIHARSCLKILHDQGFKFCDDHASGILHDHLFFSCEILQDFLLG